MNTPAHVIASLWVVGHDERSWRPAVAGALVPDLPMFVFYVWQRAVAGRPDAEIWSTVYFQPDWQLFFDAFNSLPVVAVGLVAAVLLRSAPLRVFFLSMGLHCVADLALHHDDAHRHFLPLSDWRFESPISYWDPAYHGAIFGSLEMAGLVLGAAVLLRRPNPPGVRVVAGGTLAATAAFAGFALVYWVGT